MAQRDEIYGLSPRGRLLGAARGNHLTNNGRQHGGSVLPADEVEALERLVDKVERMSAVGKGAVGLGRQQEAGEFARGTSARNGRQHGTLGSFTMAHSRPTPQPALKRGKIGPARKRRTLLARRLPLAVIRHASGAVEEGEIGLLLREQG